MLERKGIIAFQGNPLTLVGSEVKIGDPAPDFTALDQNLAPVSFSAFKGKVCIISAVPSLDTPVCDTQTRKFNKAASELGQNVVILTVSMDLPFAQKRWCGAAGIDRLVMLSDHLDASFASAYGLLIKELRLLARAVLVVGRDGKIQYFQVVPEITHEPDYDKALAKARESISK